MPSTRVKIVGGPRSRWRPSASGGWLRARLSAHTTPRAKLQRAVDALAAPGAPGVVRARPRRRPHPARGRRLRQPRHADAVRARDRFRVGSITKTFVAAVVLQLAGEGKLALEDSVERWLPGARPRGAGSPSASCSTTRAGWPTTARGRRHFHQPRARRPQKSWQPRELIAIGTAHPPLFAPGAGLVVLQHRLHPARPDRRGDQRQAAGAELRERIFTPLRLRATSFDTKPRIAGRHAHGYTRFGARRRFDISVMNQSWAWAAGAHRLDRGRPRPLLPRPARRPAAAAPTSSRK